MRVLIALTGCLAVLAVGFPLAASAESNLIGGCMELSMKPGADCKIIRLADTENQVRSALVLIFASVKVAEANLVKASLLTAEFCIVSKAGGEDPENALISNQFLRERGAVLQSCAQLQAGADALGD